MYFVLGSDMSDRLNTSESLSEANRGLRSKKGLRCGSLGFLETSEYVQLGGVRSVYNSSC